MVKMVDDVGVPILSENSLGGHLAFFVGDGVNMVDLV